MLQSRSKPTYARQLLDQSAAGDPKAVKSWSHFFEATQKAIHFVVSWSFWGTSWFWSNFERHRGGHESIFERMQETPQVWRESDRQWGNKLEFWPDCSGHKGWVHFCKKHVSWWTSCRRRGSQENGGLSSKKDRTSWTMRIMPNIKRDHE